MAETVETIDLTQNDEFESEENPFLNNDDVIDIGHNYNLRHRIAFKLNMIKLKIQELEHDLVIGFQQ